MFFLPLDTHRHIGVKFPVKQTVFKQKAGLSLFRADSIG
jgi:hypothetical protein